MFDFVLSVWNFLYCSIVSSLRTIKISTALYTSDCPSCEPPQTVVVAVSSFWQAQQWNKNGEVLLFSIIHIFLLTCFLSIWVLYSYLK